MLKFYLVIGLLLSPLGIGICGAAHPLITDDAGSMGRSNTQVEINGEYEQQKDHGTKERTFALCSTVTHGVTETGDIVLSAPYLFTRARATELGDTEREQGFGDMLVEFKWRWHEKNGLSLAVKPGLIFPAGNDRRGLGAGKVGYRFFAIATKELMPFVIHANAGYIRNENAIGERKDLWHVSVAGELPIAENVTLVANGGIDRHPDPSDRKEQYFCLGGLIWTLSKSFAFDGGLKYSATKGGEHGWSFLTGLTFRF